MTDDIVRLLKLNKQIDDTIGRLFFHQEMVDIAIAEGNLNGLIVSKALADDYKSKFLKLHNRFERAMGNVKIGGVTDEQIEQAKSYPWDQLVQLRAGWACCPFHGDKNPSFHVKNNYGKCFGCGWKGDQITFVMQQEGLSFSEAVRWLCK